MERSLKDVSWDNPANRAPGYALVLKEIEGIKQQLREIKTALNQVKNKTKDCKLSVAIDEAIHKTIAEAINERELP